MTLFHVFSISSRGVGVIYKFIKRSVVLQVESSIDFCEIIFGASYEVDTLQNIHMKNDRPLSVPFPTSFTTKPQSKYRDDPFTEPAI